MKDKLSKIDKNSSDSVENSILSKLLHRVLIQLNLINKITFLINRYIKFAHDNDIKVLKRKTRSSLINNITATSITWKTFIDLMFNLIRVREMKMTFILTHHSDMLYGYSKKNLDKDNIGKYTFKVSRDDKELLKNENSILSLIRDEILSKLEFTDRIDDIIEECLIDKTVKKTKSNLTSMLRSNEITWKTFVDTIFNILKVDKIEMQIELINANKSISMHEVKILKD